MWSWERRLCSTPARPLWDGIWHRCDSMQFDKRRRFKSTNKVQCSSIKGAVGRDVHASNTLIKLKADSIKGAAGRDGAHLSVRGEDELGEEAGDDDVKDFYFECWDFYVEEEKKKNTSNGG